MLRMLRQAMIALAFMHGRQRLHQSLGPGSLLLSSTDERWGALSAACTKARQSACYVSKHLKRRSVSGIESRKFFHACLCEQ